MKNEREVVVVLTENKISNYKMLVEFFAKKYRGNLNQKS